MILLSSADFLKKLFQIILSGTQSACQMVWIQIRTDTTLDQHYVGPDLGLMKLSADDKSWCQQQGSNLALANLLNASSFFQKTSRNDYHLLF